MLSSQTMPGPTVIPNGPQSTDGACSEGSSGAASSSRHHFGSNVLQRTIVVVGFEGENVPRRRALIASEACDVRAVFQSPF